MIHDVDRSLTNWLGRCLPAGVAVRFAGPGPGWPPQTPLVNGFLYDIREDVSMLTADLHHLRDVDGRTTARRAPTRRYRLRYLMTAWATPDENPTEHELLAAILQGGVSVQTIPADCLTGTLAEAGELVPLRCAPAGDKPVGTDFYTQFGLLPMTTLDLVVTAPLVPALLPELAPAPSEVDLRPDPPMARRPPATPANGDRPRGRITERQ